MRLISNQLSNPNLHFDYILFDEGQDASSAMLDVFFKQKATKVIIGDTHQQIYSWRFAVNSLEKADFKTFHLSTSFRFSQDIANLAMGILKWKNYLEQNNPVLIRGAGINQAHKIKAILARTNLGLLLTAIEFVIEKKKLNNIYFEGNINSYTYADDGTSLYDVLKLYNGNPQLVKDKVIKAMKNINELVDYIEKIEEGKRVIEKTYSVDEVRFKHKDAYNPWSDKLDHELTIMYWEGITLSDIAIHFGRSKGAILSRIRKLQLG